MMPTKTYALLIASVMVAAGLTVLVASQFEGVIWAFAIVAIVASVVVRIMWRKFRPDDWDK